MTTMSVTDALKIWNFPKLKGQENYYPWSQKMKIALKHNGLWNFVERDQCPTAPANATPEQIQTYESQVRSWKVMNNQAVALIYSMCDEGPCDVIEDVDGASASWSKLKEEYTRLSFALRATKYLDLCNTHLSTSNYSIKTYVSKICSNAQELELMNAKMEDWQLTSILLMNLDGKFKDFVHRLVVHNPEVPKFNEVVTLLNRESRLRQTVAVAMNGFQTEQEGRKTSGSRNSTGRGRGGNNNRNSKNGSSKNPNSSNCRDDGERPECYECTPGANGKWKKHWPIDCWSLHPEKAPRHKPKAKTKETRRPDDFVDSNTPCIHTSWLSFRQEHELDHYEFWGQERPETSIESPL